MVGGAGAGAVGGAALGGGALGALGQSAGNYLQNALTGGGATPPAGGTPPAPGAPGPVPPGVTPIQIIHPVNSVIDEPASPGMSYVVNGPLDVSKVVGGKVVSITPASSGSIVNWNAFATKINSMKPRGAAGTPGAPAKPSDALKQIQALLQVPQTGTWDKATTKGWTDWLKMAQDQLQNENFPTDLATNWKAGASKLKIDTVAGTPAKPFKADYSGMLEFIQAVNGALGAVAGPNASAPAAATPGAASSNNKITANVVNPNAAQGEPVVVNASYTPGGPGTPAQDLDQIRAEVYDSAGTKLLFTTNPLVPGTKGKKLYSIKIPANKTPAGEYMVKVVANAGKAGAKTAVQSDMLTFVVKGKGKK